MSLPRRLSIALALALAFVALLVLTLFRIEEVRAAGKVIEPAPHTAEKSLPAAPVVDVTPSVPPVVIARKPVKAARHEGQLEVAVDLHRYGGGEGVHVEEVDAVGDGVLDDHPLCVAADQLSR